MNLFAKQKYRRRHREQTQGCQWGKGSGVNWETEIDVYINMLLILCIE